MERLYALLGKPLGHSFSAPIHRRMGSPDYSLIELEERELESFLRRADLGGVNVTIPYKRTVIPLCDEIDSEARSIGAVNTIVNRDGRLVGYNTDKPGFEYALRRARIDVRNKKAVVLGSGGTSLTARAALKSLGSSEIVTISRRGEDNYDNISRHSDAAIVVNTTPVGMYPNCPAAPLSLDVFPECEGLMDVVFNPLRTGLIMEAEERGIPHTGGLPMLVAQAYGAEQLFRGGALPADIIDECITELERDVTNIVIIGMPGSGKTTVGDVLGELTGRPHVDTDIEVLTRTGSTPADIIKGKGEAAFRKLETDILRDVCRGSGQIITTGGGVVVVPENYGILHQNGRIYCLHRPLEKLTMDNRPLSKDIPTLAEMFQRRKPLYDRFKDVAVDNDESPAETAADIIWREFNEHFGT